MQKCATCGEDLSGKDILECEICGEPLFESEIEIPRIRHGMKQTFKILLNEETLVLTKFLKYERKEWIPRGVDLGNLGCGA